jgi:nucleotidyltransferase substrate binding protein (TIGR01987 family)
MTLNTKHLLRCIQTLQSALDMLNRAGVGSIDYEVFQNSVVKGFELTLETSGKLLRKTLKAYGGSPKVVDELFYKDVFRHAAKHGLLTVEEVERWFDYRDNRNNTAHDYGEAFAKETLALMPSFLADARKLEAVLREKLGMVDV